MSVSPVFLHQEKGGLFGGLLKKTPKATGDASEVRLCVQMPRNKLFKESKLHTLLSLILCAVYVSGERWREGNHSQQ